MGKKDKHKLGSTRNNPVFKVVGAKVKKQGKGRPKEVSLKLKKLANERAKSTVSELDNKLKKIQHDPNVKIGGKPAEEKKPSQKVIPMAVTESVDSKEMDSMVPSAPIISMGKTMGVLAG